jgi:hypothetical protein
MREGGKESESGAKGVNIGGRCARLHGYIANVPMVRKDEKIFVSFVGRDRESTCGIGGGPLVPKDRDELGRIVGDGGDKTGTLTRDKGKGQGNGRWGKLGSSRRDATTKSVEVAESGAVARARGGNLRTREGVRTGMLRMKLAFRALRKVEREGDPNARCQ